MNDQEFISDKAVGLCAMSGKLAIRDEHNETWVHAENTAVRCWEVRKIIGVLE